MNGWQPIETAPRDGSPFLAFNPVMGIYTTGYLEREEHENDRFPCGFTPRMGLGKWYCWPTHWMPLPAPPAALSEEPKG